jgi:two-component system, OmpR family, sensor kinase
VGLAIACRKGQPVRLPIRARVTLAFAALMAVVLTTTGVVLFLRFRSDLLQAVDAGLRSRGQAIVGELRRAAPLTAGMLIETDEAFAQVLGTDGGVIDSSPGLQDGPVLTASDLGGLRQPRFFTTTVRAANDRVPARLLAVPFDERSVVVVGASLEDRREALSGLALMLAVGGPATVVLAAGVGWVVSGLALRPVDVMRSRAAAISADDLSRRLPVPETRDELARLAETLNDMLDRVGSALDRERRFVADASHELRTPLANLKAELELALGRSRTEAELLEALASAGEETEQLVRLSEDLLVLARTNGHRPSLAREPVDVGELVAHEAAAFARLAARRGCTIRASVHVDAAVELDPRRFRQIVGNLLDNAIRHSPEGGAVRVAGRADNGGLVLEVTDEGRGFPTDFLPLAFEPFARADASRSREDGATGLGLAIVRALAEAHGGTTSARNRPGGGAQVVVTLPPS